MRRADARAANRRGWRTTIEPRPAKPASSTAGGTRVVLPAPVGARNTTAPAVRNAASTSGKTSSMGKRSTSLGTSAHSLLPRSSIRYNMIQIEAPLAQSDRALAF